MKWFFLIFLLLAGPVYGESLKKMRNPYTGDFDYYTKVSSETIPSGSTYYVQTNPTDVQNGWAKVSTISVTNMLIGIKTLSQLQTLTPNTSGQLYYCADCTTDALCVSTGATRGGFGRVSAKTTACQ